MTERQLEVAIALTIGLAGVVGLWLTVIGGPVLLVLGVLAVVAALAYTGGPWPYGYRGLGEVFVFVFFGLVAVVGTAYLQAGRLEPLFVAAAIPVGALTTAILVVNNLRDIPTDTAAGKRTLAVDPGRARDDDRVRAPARWSRSSSRSCSRATGARPGGPAAAPRAPAGVAAAADGPDVRRNRASSTPSSRRPPAWRSSTACSSRSGSRSGARSA